MGENSRAESRNGELDSITFYGKSNSTVINAPYEPGVVRPTYCIKHFSEDIYSVCKFHRRMDVLPILKEEKKEAISYDTKLDNSFSRARSAVKSYGLSNRWTYFATLTLDKEKYNRFDLKKFRKDLTQWIRDCRKRYQKKYPGCERLSFLLVPETHKNGAWHMHGLFQGIPEGELEPFKFGIHPDKLVRGGFLNWPDYSNRFGFVSLGRIRDQFNTVLYICKYITKQSECLRELKGQHLYIPSRPLNQSHTVADVYGFYNELDKCLSYHGDFCSTGLVRGKEWHWALEYDESPMEELKTPYDLDFESISEVESLSEFNPLEIDPYCYEQTELEEFAYGRIYNM